jgi:hypothetical protein
VPALNLGLVPLLRIAGEVFLGQFSGGRMLSGELVADERISGHRAIEARSELAGNQSGRSRPTHPRPKVFGNVWDSSQTRSTVKLIWSHSTPTEGGNNDQVCVVHCHSRLCPLSFIGRSRQKETARSSGQIGSGANLGARAK